MIINALYNNNKNGWVGVDGRFSIYISDTIYFKYDFFITILYILSPLYTIVMKKIVLEFEIILLGGGGHAPGRSALVVILLIKFYGEIFGRVDIKEIKI